MALPAGLSAVAIESFNGLRLDVDPEELGFQGAIDAVDVNLEPGRVLARNGTQTFASLTGIVLALQRYRRFDGDVDRLIVITNPGTPAATNVYVVKWDGTTLATGTQNTGIGSMQTIGTPAGSFVYLPTGSAWLLRYDGTSWTTPGVSVNTNGPVGLSPTDNRLVIGNLDAHSSRVMFSDPDAPETFDPLNFVDLAAGDGESIRAMATWGNQLFVFKGSKYFVFYGNSSHFAADGTEVDDFNYRTVSNGVGALNERCAAAGPDGVYFLNRSGVYRTTGGPPVKISGALDPFFSTTGSPFFNGGTVFDPSFGKGISAVGWVKNKLYVTAAVGGASFVFTWDPKLDAWSSWKAPVGATVFTAFGEMVTANVGDNATTIMLGGYDGKIRQMKPSLTTDDGVAFAPRYRSGFSDMGSPAREKTIRETEVVGTGSPSLAWSREYGSPGSAQSVSLGSSRRGLDRTAHVGELLSFQLSGTAPWMVQRLVPGLREVRGEGEETS